jgi:hypothetical protein
MVTIISQSTAAQTGRTFPRGIGRQCDQLTCALDNVGVRIFLERDQEICVAHHLGAQMIMRIELRADHDVAADDLAHPAQQIALAVVVTVGDHRAVQAEQHHLYGQRALEIVEQFVAQALVDGAGGDAAGLRTGHKPLDQRPSLFRRHLARDPQGRGKE